MNFNFFHKLVISLSSSIAREVVNFKFLFVLFVYFDLTNSQRKYRCFAVDDDYQNTGC